MQNTRNASSESSFPSLRHRHTGRRAIIYALLGIVSAVACFALTTRAALAVGSTYYCKIGANQYASDIDLPGYWYAQILTGTETPTSVSYTYASQGAKANLTTGGNPQENDSLNQHLNAHVSAVPTTPGHWTQIGWVKGDFPTCTGHGPQPTIVYVEIKDDTASPCFVASYGLAPSDASYDARYYAIVGGMYEYRSFYQAPGGSIQYLAWGRFINQYTAEISGGEVFADNVGGVIPTCPILSHSGTWNVLGKSPSSTFASYLQLWNGSSWVDWTSSSAPSTHTFSEAPYQIQVNIAYKQIQVGGGQ